MTSEDQACLVCDRSAATSLCSPRCVRAAVRQRDRNVRRLRALRRIGRPDTGADLVARNAELTEALLTGRPDGDVVT